MKLFIGTPTQSLWTPEYGHSLAWLMAELAGGSEGIEMLHHAWIDGSRLAGIRSDLAERAIEIGASHILWNDCDMKFSPGHVRSLIAHSEKDIVGVNYMRRLPPHESVAIGMDGQYLRPRSNGLEEVLYTGMGLMLTRTKVFESMPQPWFLEPWDEDRKDTVGEDVWFCKMARDHGFRVYVDHGASVDMGHVGKQVLYLDEPPKLEGLS